MKHQNDKIEAGEIVVQNRFIKWLENFWYHYKWHTIVVVFFLFTGTVCFVQCATSGNASDLTIAYAGGYTFGVEDDYNRVVEVLSLVAPEDPKGEGRLTLAMNTFSVYTDEEIRKNCIDEDGNLSTYAYTNSKKVSLDHLQTFSTSVKTGTNAIWLVSEYVYRDCELYLEKVARPLSDLYGEELPASAYDGYAIRLSQTELYQKYDALKILPADTLVLLPSSFWLSDSADEKVYANYERLFRNIVEYQG